MVAIIVPAHNEEAVIEKSLRALVHGARENELEVIVVCNGCVDRTAEVAREVGHPVRVIETDIASKCHALNLGDSEARGFPRIYVDADVILPLDAVRRVVAAMDESHAPVASPVAHTRFLPGTSWWVRAFYRFWMSLPYVSSGMVGVGTYALSKDGRARFNRFPDLIADDGFVRHSFSAGERLLVEGAVAEVLAPARLSQLIKVKTRSRLGYYQLRQRYPELFERRGEGRRIGAVLGRTLRDPRLWPCVFPYLLVNLVSRWRAGRQLRAMHSYVWERDESSRAPAMSR